MDLSKWDKFIGAPHHTVEIEGYEKGNGMDEGTPLGLNNDPLNVFSMVEMEGEPVLAISGEVYGGVNTKKEYENYHLSLQFKWGTKKYEPRLDKPMDSGILYHCQEGHHSRLQSNPQECIQVNTHLLYIFDQLNGIKTRLSVMEKL